MATFTLNDLRNEVSKKYAPTVIENGKDTYVLQNLLQLSPEKRNRVMEVVDSLDESEEDNSIDAQVDKFRELILAAEENDQGQKLLDLLGDNAALLIEVATRWMETTQVGEAERS